MARPASENAGGGRKACCNGRHDEVARKAACSFGMVFGACDGDKGVGLDDGIADDAGRMRPVGGESMDGAPFAAARAFGYFCDDVGDATKMSESPTARTQGSVAALENNSRAVPSLNSTARSSGTYSDCRRTSTTWRFRRPNTVEPASSSSEPTSMRVLLTSRQLQMARSLHSGPERRRTGSCHSAASIRLGQRFESEEMAFWMSIMAPVRRECGLARTDVVVLWLIHDRAVARSRQGLQAARGRFRRKLDEELPRMAPLSGLNVRPAGYVEALRSPLVCSGSWLGQTRRAYASG